jgi:rRNA maturation protein Nop10
MGKLKYYLKENKKVYTLKEETPDNKQKTKDAHYKFIKIKSLE